MHVQTTQQQKNYRYFVTLRRLLRRGAVTNIKKILEKIHPADVALIFGYFPVEDQVELLGYLADHRVRAEVLREMPMEAAKEIIGRLDVPVAASIICEMSGDDQADLLGALDEEVAEAILAAMPKEDSDDLQDLMHYDRRTAGGIMSPDVIAVPMDATIRSAIDMVQRAEDVDAVFYIYVVDEHRVLRGVLSLRKLVVSKPDTKVAEVMNPKVVSVHTDEDQEDVARLVTRYDLLAVPVVDDTNCLVGVVTVDDVIDVISEEATEDILKMAGAGDEPPHSPVWRRVVSRVPWLLAAMAGGIGTSFVISGFTDELAKYVMLAAFIPVITGMAGNAGTQSLAVVVRGLATRELKVRQSASALFKELAVGVLLGILFALILAVVGWIEFAGQPARWQLTASLAIAIGTAMTLSTVVATLLPLGFARINVDPAVATGPFVTTFIDIMGVTIYFSVVSLLL